ncbi:MAG TPA: glycosyltransferase [Pirellulales bacterium]
MDDGPRLRVLFCPLGSSGDVHPLIGIGRAMQARGHSVTMIANDHFEPLLRSLGFDFASTGNLEEFKDVIANPDLWHPRRGFKLLSRRMFVPLMQRIYDRILELHEPGRTVVVAPTISFGARLAQERHDVPLATVLIQPVTLRSEHDAPKLPGMRSMARWPRWTKRFLYWLADVAAIDPTLAPPLNTMRKEIGLPPVRRVLGPWSFSTDAIIGLYPEWFAPRQPDWPAHYAPSVFPRYDESGAAEVPRDVQEFLAAGDAPIVFTFGSANEQASAPLREALDAVRRLNRRALFIARSADNVPQPLPASVMHASYVPFSAIFPRCAAVVHHGGIGTTAQGLAAGIPQLIMPMGFDQFDNAERCRRLGVGEELRPQHFRGPAVAAALQRLLTRPEVGIACRACQDRLAGEVDFTAICETIERVGRSGTGRSASAPATV